MSEPERFQLGVNYWPRRKAMYWWSDFDAAEVRSEFSLIRELGLDLVRIFLLWDDWQPAPDQVSSEALGNLETVCQIAADLGLKLDVTFFTGHMSGPNWSPEWMLLRDEPKPDRVRQVVSGRKPIRCGYRNPYMDPLVMAAAEQLLTEVIGRFKDHPAIGFWNLGNEPDLFAHPPTAADGRAWAKHMASLVRDLDPNHPVTCGLHVDSLVNDNSLRVNDVFAPMDFAVMHGYPMYADWARHPLDPDFVPFLCALTTALSGKPTMMEEFGGCTVGEGDAATVWEWVSYGKHHRQYMASEAGLATYVEEVLPRLVEVGATGAVIWCFADYDARLWDRPPCDEAWHERHFGLVRPDGTVKPHTDVLRRFAETRPTIQPATRQVTLDISPEEYYRDPKHHAQRLYNLYLDQGV